MCLIITEAYYIMELFVLRSHSFLHIALFVSKRLMFSIIGTSHHEDTLNH